MYYYGKSEPTAAIAVDCESWVSVYCYCFARGHLYWFTPAVFNCIHLDVRLRGWPRKWQRGPRVNNPRVLADLASFTNWCKKCLSHKSTGWLNQSLLLLNHSGLEILLLVCEKGWVRHDFTTLFILRLALVIVMRSWQQSSHFVSAIGRVLI